MGSSVVSCNMCVGGECVFTSDTQSLYVPVCYRRNSSEDGVHIEDQANKRKAQVPRESFKMKWLQMTCTVYTALV